MYKELTIVNKSFLKRFSHGQRFKIALRLLAPRKGEKILDYGAGDGYFLKMLLACDNNLTLFGYEPVPRMFGELCRSLKSEIESQTIVLENLYENIPRNYFDKISCFEVLEHLTKENQVALLRNLKELARDNGKIIISVPIEVGLSSLAKNLARLLLRQTHGGTSFTNMLRSLFSREIKREKADYIHSHIGFNYKDLEKLLRSEGFLIQKRGFSPVPLLGSFLNSQVLFVLLKRNLL